MSYLLLHYFKPCVEYLNPGELATRLDQWLYFIRHLEDFQSIPAIFRDEVFTQAFEKAELARLGQADLDSYEHSLKAYRDLKGIIDTAFDEGKAAGNFEGRMEVARKVKAKGLSGRDISELTGLSKDEIDGI